MLGRKIAEREQREASGGLRVLCAVVRDELDEVERSSRRADPDDNRVECYLDDAQRYGW